MSLARNSVISFLRLSVGLQIADTLKFSIARIAI